MQKAADLPLSACFDSPNPPQIGKRISQALVLVQGRGCRLTTLCPRPFRIRFKAEN